MKSSSFVAVCVSVCVAVAAGSAAEPVRVIFDTDMHTDCDDVGALAVLHAFADEGRARVVGTIHTAPAPQGPACLDAINTYYGRGRTPVGRLDWASYPTNPRYDYYRNAVRHIETAGSDYVAAIAAEFPRTQPDGHAYEDGVSLYRRLLAAADDQSLVICAVGQLQGLARLLDSPADAFSPLPGDQLVTAKVRMLVSMGSGTWPSGKDGFNWRCDMQSAERVLNAWPTALVVMPHGEDVLTGGQLVKLGNPANPVRRAYDIYVKHENKLRSSWDQCAMYYAVAGPGVLFKEMRGHRLRYDGSTGEHEWVPDPHSKHVYLKQVASSAKIAGVIEELMCREPQPGK